MRVTSSCSGHHHVSVFRPRARADYVTVKDALVQLRNYWWEIRVELMFCDVVPDTYCEVEIDDKA